MFTSTIAYEDEDELDFEQTESDENNPENLEALEAELAKKANLKSLREAMHRSPIKIKQSLPFLAAVQLDEDRKNPIGLKELFTVWIERGTEKWLNPYAKLNKLNDVLLKYRGDSEVLTPFIGILKRLTKENISPVSFIEYVMLPRMKEDFGWRKWQDNHLEALNIIADTIITAKNHPPFNQERIGPENTPLSKDVVLTRYIGRPLSQYKTAQLQDETLLNEYLQTWQNVVLDNFQLIYFLRSNVLHFIYSLSGKIDLLQLVELIKHLPDIEQRFSAISPTRRADKNMVDKISLFNYNIKQSLADRYDRGYHSLDFTNEVKAYLKIVEILLSKPNGVHLCSYYASLLKRFKDPIFAQTLADLVNLVDDNGGMYIYKWHTKKLLTMRKDTWREYLTLIENNNGADPEYPRITDLFRNEFEAAEQRQAAEDAARLGLFRNLENQEEEIGNIENLLTQGFHKKPQISYKELVELFMEENPQSKNTILQYRQDLLDGKDGTWTPEFLQKLDGLSEDTTFHNALLRFVIRGIGQGYAHTKKSNSFVQLYEQYQVPELKLPQAQIDFEMPIKLLGKFSADKETLAREQINLTLISKVWSALSSNEKLSFNNLIPFINEQAKKLDATINKIHEDLAKLRPALEIPAENEEARENLEKAIAKQEKTLSVLREQYNNYRNILDYFDEFNAVQKLALTLIVSGAQKNDELYAFIITLLIQRYIKEDAIKNRLAFLKEDISIEALTYEQMTLLLNLLETLFFHLQNDKPLQMLLKLMNSTQEEKQAQTDPKIIRVIETNSLLQDILEPYIITRKRILSGEALDAAVRKITSFAALESERAKWQSILSKLDNKDSKYFYKLSLFTSKELVDAYYGDMAGICLSAYPQLIKQPGFFIQRLINHIDQQIIGMSILNISKRGFSLWHERYFGIQPQNQFFLQAFAFNPLDSFLSHLNAEQQLYLYLQFRLNMEKLAWQLKIPVIISGINNGWGLISNNQSFLDLIRSYETGKRTSEKVSAHGIAVYYSEERFVESLKIIDPREYKDVRNPAVIPSFYAHRELQKFEW